MEASGVPRYRHRSDPANESIIRELASAWTADRAGIASLLGSAATDPLRSFSDAFKLKR
jgi:hypothetical protein